MVLLASVLADRALATDPTARPGRAATELAPQRGERALDAFHDTTRYRSWLEERHRLGVDAPLERPPTAVSFALAMAVCPDDEPSFVRRCLDAVRAQRWDDWQLCVADGSHGDPVLGAIVADAAAADRRITTVPAPEGGPSADDAHRARALHRALGMGGGDWSVILGAEDELDADALGAVAATIGTHPDATLVYSDEDQVDATGQRCAPQFKPDWAPDLLLSYGYVGGLLAVRTDVLRAVGGLRPELAGGACYDLMLRVTEQPGAVVHVPRVLYHRRLSARGPQAAFPPEPRTDGGGRRALEDALERRSTPGRVEAGPLPRTYTVRYALRGSPLVSVIIPFRDQPGLTRLCVDSIRRDPGYDRYEIVLVDNDSAEPETAALVDRLSADPRVRVLEHPGAFNWSRINNVAAEHAAGDVLAFLNNDVEDRRGGWMRAMLEHAQRPEIGAVGARLLYPDGTLQHAGVVHGLGAIAAHVLSGIAGDDPGYLAAAAITRNWSAVTAAAMMCRREVFTSVGRFDEDLQVAFNDVDFCLRVTDAGFRILTTPCAELVHYESASRGFTGFYHDYQRFLARWLGRLVAGDPLFSPNLSRLHFGCVVRPVDEDERWETELRSLLSSSSS